MRRTRVRLLAPALALVLTALPACGDDPIGPTFPEDVEYDPSLGVDLDQMTELDSGVYIQTLVEGEGVPVVEGDRLIADYTLWLPDATQVDQATDYDFVLGGQIDGFVEGVRGMLKGETRLIVIPSDLGYGASGTGTIPPNSVLIFEVTVNDVNPPI